MQKPMTPGEGVMASVMVCERVVRDEHGVIRGVEGIGWDLILTSSLPTTIEPTVLVALVGPPGRYWVAVAVTQGHEMRVEELAVANRKEVTIPPLPEPCRIEFPISVTFDAEGQFSIDVFVNDRQLVARYPVGVKIHGPAAGIH